MWKNRFMVQAPLDAEAGAGAGGSSAQVDDKPGEGKSGSEGGKGGTPDAGAGEGKADGEGGELDVSKLDPKAQKLIKDLRRENADSRKRNKTLDESHGKLKAAMVQAGLIEDDAVEPEVQLKAVSEQHDYSVFQNAVLEAAIEHDVGKADLKYFRFLVQERLEQLGENDELDSDAIAELATQARRATSPGASGSTSVDSKAAPKPGATGSVTLDQFVRMNMSEKSDLYVKNKDAYTALIAEAKSKKMIV